jgi:hypothetical protein
VRSITQGAAGKEMAGWTGHCGFGGAEGDRTLDLRIANATLSQLSYRPDMIAGTNKSRSMK